MEYGEGYVTLLMIRQSIKKEFTFLPNTYEIQVKDTVEGRSVGKAFASLYRTEGRSLDLKTEIIQGGMMNKVHIRLLPLAPLMTLMRHKD